jgi:RND family efflux transporter MFP subunit
MAAISTWGASNLRFTTFLTGLLTAITPISVHAQEAAPRPAKVFTVAESQEELRRTYPAIVLPSRETALSFRVGGQVIDLPIRAAQQVAKGDLIARLDTRDLKTQIALLQSQKDQAVAQLDALRAGARPEEIAALEAGVAAVQAQVDVTREALERTRALVERGVATSAQLEGAEGEFRVAQANLSAQQEQLRIGQVGGRPEEIAAAEAALRGLEAQIEQAQNQLADASLKAPFDGVIARRDIENFSNIQAGSGVALLQTLSPAHLAFDIPGADVSTFIQLGVENITTTARFDAFPGQEFETEVVEFSVDADSATQTYRGRVSVDLTKVAGAILPGMVANVVATLKAGTDTQILVPLAAIGAEAAGAPFVWTVTDNNSVAASAVTLGDISEGMIEVTSGVAPGDMIVAAGVSRITAGQVIRPMPQVGN